jgi:hypothetical protein
VRRRVTATTTVITLSPSTVKKRELVDDLEAAY